jgi:hypothetical protein
MSLTALKVVKRTAGLRGIHAPQLFNTMFPEIMKRVGSGSRSVELSKRRHGDDMKNTIDETCCGDTTTRRRTKVSDHVFSLAFFSVGGCLAAITGRTGEPTMLELQVIFRGRSYVCVKYVLLILPTNHKRIRNQSSTKVVTRELPVMNATGRLNASSSCLSAAPSPLNAAPGA